MFHQESRQDVKRQDRPLAGIKSSNNQPEVAQGDQRGQDKSVSAEHCFSIPEIHELHRHGKFMGAHGGVKRVATRAHD
jgi:hypothetical protein